MAQGDVKCFEQLDAWQAARQIIKSVYAFCKDKDLRKNFGLKHQLQRAAVSVMINVAEGFDRAHVSEKLQFYNIARASCGEVRSLLYVVQDNYPEIADAVVAIRADLTRTGQLVSGLIRSTKRRTTT